MVIAVAWLTNCIEINAPVTARMSGQELGLGDWALGRFAWEFNDVVLVNPGIPQAGKQSLWVWDAAQLKSHKPIDDQWGQPRLLK
jgi:hypothetical protein